MTDDKTTRRFARVYYDDLERDYPAIFYDPTALSTWMRLLILCEKAWPALPELPKAARRADLEKLVSAGILVHHDHHRFVLKGWLGDRQKRAEMARKAVGSRKDRSTFVPTSVGSPVPSFDLLRASVSTSISEVSTEGVQGEPSGIDAFYHRTGEVPGPKMRDWLNELADTHGEGRLAAAIGETPMTGTNSSVYVRAIRDRLRLEDAQAERTERLDEKRRRSEKRVPLQALPPADDISEEEARRLAEEYTAAARAQR